MTTQPERPEEARWLLEPPEPSEIRVRIAVGDQAEVTPEFREALERMMAALHTEEVIGYGPGALPPSCPDVSCHLGNCWPESRAPCYTDYRCKIKTPPKVGG